MSSYRAIPGGGEGGVGREGCGKIVFSILEEFSCGSKASNGLEKVWL